MCIRDRLFVNSQLKVNAVTIRSPEGLKVIWLDNNSGNMRVSYGIKGDVYKRQVLEGTQMGQEA